MRGGDGAKQAVGPTVMPPIFANGDLTEFGIFLAGMSAVGLALICIGAM